MFQPIVDLETGQPVAYEALARGPAGTALQSPDALFAWAASAGRVAELDRACRGVAMAEARRAGRRAPLQLFLNVEPGALGALDDVITAQALGLPVMLEVTERDLVADPAHLFATLDRVRAAGCHVALDDVGADPASLALLPLVRPDVIKLDLALVQERTSADRATVVSACRAEAERTGALLLAEGIEHDEHLERALVLGAQLGQGWRFGRPGPLPAPSGHRRPDRFGALGPVAPLTTAGAVPTPFEVAAAHRPVRRATKSLLLPISRHLERCAATEQTGAVVLGAFQHRRHFDGGTARHYEHLAEHATFVAAIAAELPAAPARGVRGADLLPGDPLAEEWNVIVVGAHFAGALLARDIGSPVDADRDRCFDYVVTHDRTLVADAARALMARIAPAADRLLVAA